jgi:hypothetical protein
MSGQSENDRQQLWLWVAKPAYTQDPLDQTRDRPDMEEPGWWTCHEDTKRGDLALLYVTAPFSEVRWLIRTETENSELVDLRDDPDAQAEGWEWGTEYTVLARFSETVTFTEMRETQTLKNWDAIARKLRGEKGSWPVPKAYWKALQKRLVSRNPETERAFLDNMRPCGA